eukprot:3187947-Rhodomonas_salina.2
MPKICFSSNGNLRPEIERKTSSVESWERDCGFCWRKRKGASRGSLWRGRGSDAPVFEDGVETRGEQVTANLPHPSRYS